FDSMIASIIAAVLIATLLVLAFHSFRTPLMLMITLGVAVAWSFGYLTLAVGHLQVISVIFTVILLGLGVGFGIHFASRFELVRHNYTDDAEGFEQALADTFRTMGPGILTGAITTAAAFSTTLFTNFTGVAEMGIIAAGGILLCLVAMFSVFPALLRLTKPSHRHIARLQDRVLHFFEEPWVMPFVRNAKATLIGAGIVTVLALIAVSQMRFDYNLLELLPRNIESAKWQQRIVEVGEESVYFGISVVDDLDEARRLADEYRKLDSVQPQLGGIARIFPANENAKLAAIEETRKQLGDALTASPPPAPSQASGQPDLPTTVQQFNLMLGLAGRLAGPQLQPALDELKQSFTDFSVAAAALDPDTRKTRLDALQHDFIRLHQQTQQQLQGLLDPSSIKPDDLPRSLLNSYIAVDEDGSRRFALEIYPKTPGGVSDPLDPRFLGQFLEDMRSVDPAVTGVIVQIYESGRLIWVSYVQAGIYALLAVFALVWIDFRCVRDAALTLVPVATGFAVTFGIMYLFGIQINPANIIVLPLMFGIGVDAGVHIIHRFRMDSATRPLGLSAGTGKAISLTSYTTMIGFGSMLIASHRGIQSLGFVLAVGIGMTLLACWTIMPAWLELRARHKISTASVKAATPADKAD
ncbi:MAG: MMPL family transporter, partial [Rhodospirillales bacterium]|nr:MMPL family transporter [Rhodospirillales bacterium]